MRLLIAGALWVAASVPLALVAGRILRGSSRSGGLVEEVEGYLRRQAPSGRRWPRSSGALLFAAGLVAAVVLLGNEAVQQLPPAEPVADRRADAQPATTTTVAPEAGRSSPATTARADTHRTHVDQPVAMVPSPAGTTPTTVAGKAHEERHERPAHGEDEATTATSERPTTTEAPRQEDERHHRKHKHGGDDEERPTPTTSSSTTSTTEPATTTTSPGSTPAGSTTTAPSTTTTTTPDDD